MPVSRRSKKAKKARRSRPAPEPVTTPDTDELMSRLEDAQHVLGAGHKTQILVNGADVHILHHSRGPTKGSGDSGGIGGTCLTAMHIRDGKLRVHLGADAQTMATAAIKGFFRSRDDSGGA